MDTISKNEVPILIVDDSKQYSRVLSMMLKQGFGYSNITTVDSVDDGYRLIADTPERFDLIFVDYHFPTGQTGGELLGRLASESLMDGKVAFLITSEPSVDNVKEAKDAGAMGVVAKPFDRDQLRKQLEKAARSLAMESTDSF